VRQSGEFDAAKRKALIGQMIDLTQRDLPYLVLTEDPWLEAYRSDRLQGLVKACPKPVGDVMCQQVSYETMLAVAPKEGGSDGGSSAGIFIAIGVVLLAGIAFVLIRRRGRGGREPLEVET
jgi:LPXTG-motif cell wall-anchored protein